MYFLSVPLCLCGVLSLCTLASCGKPPEKKQAGDSTSYDPKKDPLVNPPSLFEPPPDERSRIATDETLYIQLDGSPNTLNLLFQSSTFDFIVMDALYEYMFTFDSEMTWSVNENMVEKFEHNDNYTEFTVTLREGLKWHDGHPLTAHDVVFSWQNILDDRVPCPAVRSGTEEVKECIALDDRTVKLVTKNSVGSWMWNIYFPIIPKHLFESQKEQYPDLKTGEYYTKLGRNAVGNGPYRFVEWKEQIHLIFERWEEYPGPKPYFKRIVYKIVPDHNSAMLSFEKGSLDVLRQIPSQQFAVETTGNKSFEAVGYKAWAPEWAFVYIGWNMDGSNPFFADKRVRYAMTHALNMPAILDSVFYNLHPQCHGIYHPDSWMYNDDIKLLDYDPEKSAKLLDAAGWRVDPGDGWRYKTIDGEKVKFSFEMLIAQGRPDRVMVAEIFQQDLRKLGVELTTRVLEWSAFLEITQNHAFQAHIAGWGTGTDPDTGWNLWRSEEYEKGGRNYGKYSNPEVDRLFEEGRFEFDQEKRGAIYAQISKLIYDDQPYTFIVNQPTLAVFNKRIRGVQFSPRGIYNFSPSYMGWWTPRGGSAAAAFTP